ncbi:transcription termination factor NusA [[Clostridium] symbiosum]|uniref:transcription termination factor NusA n=1 Tax=Clostridium symbiosum TaxID=1512 RepID=UPI001D062F80|nr:transcription termination factor NusA [[Clostridium] symbiosum]MCB6609540.1 transcription termination factor NusA [[Clostridium] symbiosum]MCB6931484.1 transcription termination factor NusA [[Clostridium] symbiosum]
MNKELIEALNVLEKENNISKDILLEAIENSLLTACKNHFGKADNVKVTINRETGDFSVYAEKEVVEDVEDPMLQISLAEAKMMNGRYDLGDIVHVQINSKEFGRIATQNAKNVILQKIREEERKALFNDWYCKEKDVVTGIVQRYVNRNICIDLGKIDAILNESEQVKGEVFKPTERVKLYVLEVKDTNKGPRITVSRTHPDLVKRLFESEVAEVRDGTVEIKAIAREAGSRTKIAVYSNNEDVDPVGACVGLNGARVNAIVSELRGEKIDIINWDENPAYLIENALSPAKVIFVAADEDAREAQVIVPDYQLSLAIGKEGQNARLAARLTGYKIDIKSETQARESGLLDDLELGYEQGFEGYADENFEGFGDEAYTEEITADESIETEADTEQAVQTAEDAVREEE